MTNRPAPDRFAHVTDWVFDLDNTLYPHHSNLFSQIDVKMTAYVSEFLQLGRDEARALQKQLYKEHGTTLNGLMARYDIDPDDFLEKVHDIAYDHYGKRVATCSSDNMIKVFDEAGEKLAEWKAHRGSIWRLCWI